MRFTNALRRAHDARIRRAIVVGCITSAVAIAGCGGADNADRTNAGKQDGAKAPIVIGAALALSGPFEVYDAQALNTAKLYVDALNARGGIDGRSVKFVEADTRSDPKQGPIAAKQVINDGADVVLVSCDFDFGSPAAVTAIAAEKLNFSVCAGSPKFGPMGIGPLSFTIGDPAEVAAAAAAEWAISKGWKTAYLLVDTSIEYEKAYGRAFTQAWEHFGGTIAGEDTFKNGDSSIATQAAKIKSQNQQADVVVLASYLPGGANAVRQLRSSGVDIPILTNPDMEGKAMIAQVPNLKDFYFANYASIEGNDSDATVNEIIDDYKSEHGKAPDTSYALMGWALMEVLERAITDSGGSTEGAALVKTLEQFTKVPTVVGPTTFDERLHISVDRTMNINEVRNGKSVFLTKVEPSYVPPVVP